MAAENEKFELPEWQKPASCASEYHSCQATRGREFVVRMNTGADPTLAIERFARENNIRFGKVHATFMGGLKPCRYYVWVPDVTNPDRIDAEEVAEIQNLSMIGAIGGMIGQRQGKDGQETFVAMHFVAGGGWNVPTFCGHLAEGTKVSGALQVFITELLDIDVLTPENLADPFDPYPENFYKYTKE